MFQKGFSKILILIVALVVIAGGVLVWQYWPEQISTSDWITYRSIQGEWEISFPADYICYRCELEDLGNNIFSFSGDNLSIVSEEYDSTKSIGSAEDETDLAFEIDPSTKKPADQSLLEYFQLEIEQFGPEVEASINEERIINGHKMVKVKVDTVDAVPETQRSALYKSTDVYVFEKDPTTILSIIVMKLDPKGVKERASEIEGIISTFKFID